MAGRNLGFKLAAARAEELWELYDLKSPRDLVLEDIAFAKGIVVLEGRLDSADARLVRHSDRGIIRINESIPEPGRKRFAVAHELGHWCLHGHLTQVLACTSEDMTAAYRSSDAELEANHFASALLMPRKLMSPRIDGTRPNYRLLSQLAEEFRTSLTATAIRYVELRDDFCAVVVSETGKVRWWRESQDFKGQFWIEPGTPVPAASAAAAIFRGRSGPVGPDPIDVSDWLPETTYLTGTLVEQAIELPRYKQVLSLLWLQ